MSDQGLDKRTRRQMRYRLLQVGLLLVLGVLFFVAALADTVFGSKSLGWACLGGMLLAALGVLWAGRRADSDL